MRKNRSAQLIGQPLSQIIPFIRPSHDPMGTLTAIRAQRRLKRLNELRQGAQAIGAGRAGAELWLFGSLARGDWDAYSDVDLLAVAPSKVLADHLADALRLNP